MWLFLSARLAVRTGVVLFCGRDVIGQEEVITRIANAIKPDVYIMDILTKFDNNYMLGCIKYNTAYNFYLMPIAYWILNYKKYDPDYNPSDWEFVFRDNILNVTDKDVPTFINAIALDEVGMAELKSTPAKTISQNMYFFVDFDKKEFISSFTDIELERYLPNDQWTGKCDFPVNYLPEPWKDIFKNE